MQKAEENIFQRHVKEYAPITGTPNFTKLAAELAYGKDSQPLKDGRVSVTQSISGTGALRIGMAFLSKFYEHGKTICAWRISFEVCFELGANQCFFAISRSVADLGQPPSDRSRLRPRAEAVPLL